MKIGLIVAGVLVLFGILAVGCLALGANEVSKSIDSSMGEASTKDYKISDEKCLTDDMLGAKATGTIQNTSDKAQGFEVQVRFETTDGALISEDSTFTDTIDVGQTQDYEVLSIDDVPEGASLSCQVSEVSYTIFDDEEGN